MRTNISRTGTKNNNKIRINLVIIEAVICIHTNPLKKKNKTYMFNYRVIYQKILDFPYSNLTCLQNWITVDTCAD